MGLAVGHRMWEDAAPQGSQSLSHTHTKALIEVKNMDEEGVEVFPFDVKSPAT